MILKEKPMTPTVTALVEFFTASIIGRNLASSLTLIGVILLARIASLRGISKTKGTNESRLEWKSFIKTTSNIVLVVGLLVVWGSELRTFALSLVAIAVAIVIATKELILCFMGGILKYLSRPFKIGDRIEISNYRGDVVEHNFVSTTLWEIGPSRISHMYTGRRVVFPNSLLLNHGLLNETKRFEYGLHTFTVSLPADIDVSHHFEALQASANHVCKDHLANAQSCLNTIGAVDGVDAPTAEPRVSVNFSAGVSVDLIVRIPIRRRQSERFEQAVLHEYVKRRSAQTPGLTTAVAAP